MSEQEGRLPLVTPDGLGPEQQALYAAIVQGPRAGGPVPVVAEGGWLLGPFNALLHAPGIGAHVERLGRALRFGGELEPRTRELVICAVAAHWRSEYEWYAHSRVGRALGVSDADLAAVRDARTPEGAAPSEVAALRLARSLLRDRTVPREVYDEAADQCGTTGVVEVCVLVGYYQLLAGLLAAAAVPAPAGEDEEQVR